MFVYLGYGIVHEVALSTCSKSVVFWRGVGFVVCDEPQKEKGELLS